MEPAPSNDASDLHEARLPPQIIRIPAPALTVRLLVWYVVLLALFFAVLLPILRWAVVTRSPAVLPLPMIGELFDRIDGLAIGAVVGVLLVGVPVWIVCRRLSRLRRDEPDPLRDVPAEHYDFVEAVRDIWKISNFRPKAQRILELLDRHRATDPARATILVLGEVDFPEAHDHFLEPGVITPPRMFLARHLTGIGIVIGLFVVHFVQRIVFDRSVPAFGSALGALVIAGLAFWVVDRFRSNAPHGAYMRFAPGVVQFLRYSFPKKSTPVVRSYPITGGTTVIVSSGVPRVMGRRPDGKPMSKWRLSMRRKNRVGAVRLTLMRGDHVDTVPIGQLPDSEAIQRALFDALVSTATIPELSDTELTR